MVGGGGDDGGKLPSVDHVPLCNEGAVVKRGIQKEYGERQNLSALPLSFTEKSISEN